MAESAHYCSLFYGRQMIVPEVTHVGTAKHIVSKSRNIPLQLMLVVPGSFRSLVPLGAKLGAKHLKMASPYTF